MDDLFRKFAQAASNVTGNAWCFLLAASVVVVWAVSGPAFGFSDTWQLVINTGTTVVTFLMVFLIQNTQNRDTKAIHAKLDELIVHEVGAHNKLVFAEDLSEEDLAELKKHYEKIANGQKKKTSPSVPASSGKGGKK
jgi:low affinity Fe/Cu permease